jgi:hypothetical protein
MNNDQLTILSGGRPLYVDKHHLSVEGVDFVKTLLDEATTFFPIKTLINSKHDRE